ncbi:winged helix-turn-helix domain-containing protein [Mucilaginibacter sabulilitoris]|uniref:Winged helix-turn-helix domain-containing protein n=1 Tax=Mucilaginibacter sabulilitoris TaxID=1173583 RepID=A0ABZ0TIP5_9SPHI|nr:winged helix-turn-helix domain-containing protein [Mucilaginibacter sabulilitoris]WPU91445.1 winged helix-turn-helix domain-containing protein [Mucilaginibacter sabulilitoris]
MDKIIQEIKKLTDVPSYSKHDRFVQGMINAINEKIIVQDEMLPSVNKLIKELGFSRETIMKGYKDLISRGIVESKNRLGYFVGNGNTEQTLNVALLMYNLDTFEEQFYRNFRHTLGSNIHLSTYFHHGDIEIFETILTQIKAKYGMYVIAPIPHPKTKELLDIIPRNKLLMFDRFEPLDGDFNHITQEFGQSSYEVFSKLAPQIRQFKEMVFYHSPDSLDPKEIVQSFKKFLKDFNIKGRVEREYIPGSVEKGKVYFTLDNFALWQIMRDCNSQKLKPGKDLGVLSHNDEPAKEIIGITTFSADFSNMGKMAGLAVLNKEKIQLTVPMILFERSTL